MIVIEFKKMEFALIVLTIHSLQRTPMNALIGLIVQLKRASHKTDIMLNVINAIIVLQDIMMMVEFKKMEFALIVLTIHSLQRTPMNALIGLIVQLKRASHKTDIMLQVMNAIIVNLFHILVNLFKKMEFALSVLTIHSLQRTPMNALIGLIVQLKRASHKTDIMLQVMNAIIVNLFHILVNLFKKMEFALSVLTIHSLHRAPMNAYTEID